MKLSFARECFGHVGLVANLVVTLLSALFVLPKAAAIFETKSQQKTTDAGYSISALEQKSLDGKTEEVRELAAEQLAALNGPEATQAMRNVLERCREVSVKIAVIQGLARNKDFQCGPFLFRIMEQDDDLVILRHQAYIATTRFMSDHFYKARAPLQERQEKVKEMKSEWEERTKKKEAKAAANGK